MQCIYQKSHPFFIYKKRGKWNMNKHSKIVVQNFNQKDAKSFKLEAKQAKFFQFNFSVKKHKFLFKFYPKHLHLCVIKHIFASSKRKKRLKKYKRWYLLIFC
mgnify:FL=1